jgi:hypothetical protein
MWRLMLFIYETRLSPLRKGRYSPRSKTVFSRKQEQAMRVRNWTVGIVAVTGVTVVVFAIILAGVALGQTPKPGEPVKPASAIEPVKPADPLATTHARTPDKSASTASLASSKSAR